MRALLSAGADKDKARDDGATPLFAAAGKGHIEVVRALLSAGAETSRRTSNGHTGLAATIKGYRDIVLLLKQAAQ